jgi:hypothetical protein
LKAYEPTIEIRERSSRAVFVEAAYSVETGEAERIAVDWTAKGGAGGTSCACINEDASAYAHITDYNSQWDRISRTNVRP